MNSLIAGRAVQAATRHRLVLVVPMFVLMIPVFLVPLGVMFRISLDHFTGVISVPALTSENYRHFLGDSSNLSILLNTLLLGLEVTLLSAVLSYPLAYTIRRARPFLRTVLVVIVLIPLMTSVVARSYGWTILLLQAGPLNRSLQALGLPSVHLLFSIPGTVLALTEVLMPFMVLSLVASLQHLNPEYEDAARGLGAGPLRVFADVVLPMSLPGLMVGSLLVFVQAISAFATPALIGGLSISVLSTFIYTEATTLFNWPLAAAASFVLLTVVLVITYLQGRVARRPAQ